MADVDNIKRQLKQKRQLLPRKRDEFERAIDDERTVDCQRLQNEITALEHEIEALRHRLQNAL
jgi:polyhydroxyalkanoate synthesis regulator phasin